ncbi:hypothetical protein ACFLQL_00535 [Verrucomicrobiota bacterium]
MIKVLYLMDQRDFDAEDLSELDLNKYYEIAKLPMNEFSVNHGTPEKLFYQLLKWSSGSSFVRAGIRKIGLGDVFNFYETDYCVALKDTVPENASNVKVKKLPDLILVYIKSYVGLAYEYDKKWKDDKWILNN